MSLRRWESYLWRKSPDSSFYFRCRIPKDLLPVLNKRVIELSLQSGILKESKSLSKNLFCFCQEVFSSMRKGSYYLSIQGCVSLLKNIVMLLDVYTKIYVHINCVLPNLASNYRISKGLNENGICQRSSGKNRQPAGCSKCW